MMFTPRMCFLTKGVGRHKEKLSSFEEALRDAQIAKFNLVHVSSIFPPHCKVIPAKKGLERLKAGSIVFCVMARNETNEYRRLAAASVGLAIPKDPNDYGYLSEHHAYGQNDSEAADYCEDLAAQMLATTLGVSFDPDASWNEKEQVWKISGQFVKTTNATQSAIGERNGMWTTVVASCVFVP